MLKKSNGIAPVLIILLITMGLIGGTAAGYAFREPLKKAIAGQTTAEEIKQKVDDEIAKIEAGKSKFELEGTTSSVEVSSKIIIVKIKSSTNSIKELRLSETPITLSDTVKIISGSTEDLKIGDIPINAQVHVGGTIKDGKLTATKVIIQKEDASEGEGNVAEKNFEIGGTVKSVAAGEFVVTVTSASKKANSQKGKDLTIKTIDSTTIKKGDATIALADVKANDQVEVEGTISNDIYTASKIEVKVAEQGVEIQDTNGNSGNNSNRNVSPSPTTTSSGSVNGNSQNKENQGNGNSGNNGNSN